MSQRYYFGYGSNLNAQDWEAKCRKMGFGKGQLKSRSVGYLPDHDVAFAYPSVGRKGGTLDIVPRLGQLVPGVIFEASDAGWRALDQKEGVPRHYARMDAVCIDQRGNQVPVTTYKVIESQRQRFVSPSQEYVEIVRAGLEAYGLPTGHLLAAAADQATPWLTDGLFVYGTLLRGESRFPILQPFGLRCALLARTFGRLLDLGSFPGLVDVGESKQMVEGEFLRFERIADVIELLDQIEGFKGFSADGSLFRRTLANVDVGEGRIRQGWTYVFDRPSEGIGTITSGDWRAARGSREQFLQSLVAAHVGENEHQIAEEIADRLPFSMHPDRHGALARLVPLAAALQRGEVSERILSQQSGKWAVVPGSIGDI